MWAAVGPLVWVKSGMNSATLERPDESGRSRVAFGRVKLKARIDRTAVDAGSSFFLFRLWS
jgi:hypothetical protein